ncbi:hypothetical protein [Dryocola sp. BD626]|uniref:hypothetical protein n=1 Tax=Dryocola sp. BD626 TaxID=3133273 RepID=UPI003F500189
MKISSAPMTDEQLDELMSTAVQMQQEGEKLNDRSVAAFAYGVQMAVLELRSVRSAVEALRKGAGV